MKVTDTVAGLDGSLLDYLVQRKFVGRDFTESLYILNLAFICLLSLTKDYALLGATTIRRKIEF